MKKVLTKGSHIDYKKHHFQWRRSIPIALCCLCILTLVINGCTPLRKKFTRKKKKNGEASQKFIPVLEPIDYAEKIYSPLEKYKHHYSLWKVWDKDLLQTIDRDGSDKRQKYLLVQTIEQLEEMKKILSEEKKTEFTILIDDLREVQEVYKKQAMMRNTFSIKKKIERNASKIRNQFAPDPSLFQQE